MSELKIDAEPGEVGLDAGRLQRLDACFRRYVDEGRLAGWTVAVSRRGRVAHLTHHGLADIDTARPVADDTLWRGADLAAFGRPVSGESAFEGIGFGLGVSVVVDPTAGRVLTSAGEYGWSGLARTAFYVDPIEEITTMFFTQLLPGPQYPIGPRLRSLVAQAVVG